MPTSDGTYIVNNWKVMEDDLSCHWRPGSQSVLTTFSKGDALFTPTAFGSANNISPVYYGPETDNQVPNLYPWLLVTKARRTTDTLRGASGRRPAFDEFGNGGVCFVRANERFIVPDVPGR